MGRSDTYPVGMCGKAQATELIHYTPVAVRQATLVCLDVTGAPLKRVWCLYECDNTITIHGPDRLQLLTTNFSVKVRARGRSRDGVASRRVSLEGSCHHAGRGCTRVAYTPGTAHWDLLVCRYLDANWIIVLRSGSLQLQGSKQVY